MRRIDGILALALCVALALSGAGFADSASVTAPGSAAPVAAATPVPDLPWRGTPAHASNMDRFERILREYQAVGASIVLIKDGRVVDAYNYGRANRGDGIPVTDETLFRVASVTKMVTMVGFMRLWETGAFNLDDELGEHYGFPVRNPYYPDDPVTIRQVMTHTASLLDSGHYYRALNGDTVSLQSVFTGNYSTTDFQRRRPGTYYAYSNFGGSLLGSMVELFTGMTADEWMHEAIYRKLGITASYFTPNLPAGAPIARIYNGADMTLDSMALTDGDMVDDPLYHYTSTAGSLSISALDLAKVLVVLMGDGTYEGVRVLNASTVETIRAPQNTVGSVYIDTDRGLDLNIYADSIVKGRVMYGHQGKAYGAICAAYFDPTDQSGVVLLTNGCDDSTFNSVARIARAVISAAYEMMF
ncbi:MAG: beta-lactamase family protein [Oscillospiraceae bacterium]|jgi:CubicO group peptidase (beta-lactamase class C family)|nr:beta-lactamase family protein [Oscillospiraceae bacterium]